MCKQWYDQVAQHQKGKKSSDIDNFLFEFYFTLLEWSEIIAQ